MGGFSLALPAHVNAAGRCLVVLLAGKFFLSVAVLILMERYSNSSTYAILYRSLSEALVWDSSL